MKGWFDAFRDDGAPTLYSFSNRTPVTGDVSVVAVSVLFATLYMAFLVIFPGVRKQVKIKAVLKRILASTEAHTFTEMKNYYITINIFTFSEIFNFHNSFAELICRSGNS